MNLETAVAVGSLPQDGSLGFAGKKSVCRFERLGRFPKEGEDEEKKKDKTPKAHVFRLMTALEKINPQT